MRARLESCSLDAGRWLTGEVTGVAVEELSISLLMVADHWGITILRMNCFGVYGMGMRWRDGWKRCLCVEMCIGMRAYVCTCVCVRVRVRKVVVVIVVACLLKVQLQDVEASWEECQMQRSNAYTKDQDPTSGARSCFWSEVCWWSYVPLKIGREERLLSVIVT